MHWIQHHILITLSRHESASYSQLKPKDVEGNLFTYHLQRLITQGLIEKTDGGYQLTERGREDVVSLRLSKRGRSVSPQVVVAVAYVHKNETVLFRWNRAPYRDQVSLPFGRVSSGIALRQEAASQLSYKTGLNPEQLEIAGVVELQLYRHNELIRHQIIHIYKTSGGRDDVFADGLTGHPEWMSAWQMKNIRWVPGHKEIIAELGRSKAIFYRELKITE